jgi:hypothetical protein
MQCTDTAERPTFLLTTTRPACPRVHTVSTHDSTILSRNLSKNKKPFPEMPFRDRAKKKANRIAEKVQKAFAHESSPSTTWTATASDTGPASKNDERPQVRDSFNARPSPDMLIDHILSTQGQLAVSATDVHGLTAGLLVSRIRTLQECFWFTTTRGSAVLKSCYRAEFPSVKYRAGISGSRTYRTSQRGAVQDVFRQ